MFQERLKELRKEKGYSQKVLAARRGVSQQAVGKWETGRSSPDPATLARHAGQTVLAASHGAALHALLTCALRRPMSEFWAVNLDNCCVAVLESSGGPFHLKEVLGKADAGYAEKYLK